MFGVECVDCLVRVCLPPLRQLSVALLLSCRDRNLRLRRGVGLGVWGFGGSDFGSLGVGV